MGPPLLVTLPVCSASQWRFKPNATAPSLPLSSCHSPAAIVTIGGMKTCTTFFAVVALSAMSIFAQEQTKDQTDKAMQPAQTRLPEDQPKTATSPSAAATSPTRSDTTTTSTATAPAGQPNEADMMKQMMEMAKLNENHKLLADLNGTWSYTVKFWPAPGAPPQESKGTAIRKSMMGGRFFVMDVSGKMQMPDPATGKMKSTDFKGQGIEGYDNAKQKFVGTWVDNMGTGIMTSEGTYDPAGKTFSFTAEYEIMPRIKQQMRETLKLTDKDHMNFEMFENRGGQEVKTMEINYTRKK
jgi:hypothetical protein